MTTTNNSVQQTNQSTPAQRQQTPTQQLSAMIAGKAMQEQFKNALGDNAGTFTASLIEMVASDQNLQKCPPAQIVAEALKAASMKLPVNKSLGFAYIIPYNNKGQGMTPTFQIGYKGLIQLALRTGQYRGINADVVYEGELIRADKLRGTINLDGERKSDKVVGYFAYIELVNGFSKTLYMSVEQVAHHAIQYSRSVPRGVTEEKLRERAGQVPTGLGWWGNFDSMALKTVLRQLISKYGFMSIEMQDGVIADQDGDEATANATAARDAMTAVSAEYTEVVDPAEEAPTEEAPEEVKENDEPDF